MVSLVLIVYQVADPAITTLGAPGLTGGVSELGRCEVELSVCFNRQWGHCSHNVM